MRSASNQSVSAASKRSSSAVRFRRKASSSPRNRHSWAYPYQDGVVRRVPVQGLRPGGAHRFQPAAGAQELGQVSHEVGVRVQFDRLPIGVDGPVRVAGVAQGVRQLGERLVATRSDRHGHPEVADGQLRPLLLPEVAEQEVDPVVARVAPVGLVQHGQRFVPVVVGQERAAQPGEDHRRLGRGLRAGERLELLDVRALGRDGSPVRAPPVVAVGQVGRGPDRGAVRVRDPVEPVVQEHHQRVADGRVADPRGRLGRVERRAGRSRSSGNACAYKFSGESRDPCARQAEANLVQLGGHVEVALALVQPAAQVGRVAVAQPAVRPLPGRASLPARRTCFSEPAISFRSSSTARSVAAIAPRGRRPLRQHPQAAADQGAGSTR